MYESILKSQLFSNDAKGEFENSMYGVKRHNNLKVKFGILCVLLIVCAMQTIDSERSTTILYSTDISVDGDLDDYFDLVAIESLDNVDLKIIVDGTDMTQKKSGVQAICNLTEIGGREPDILLGRNNNLSASADADISYELVKFLEESKGKIDIVTVGSLRDIAALYNYSPKLFENKVGRIYVFAGDAEGTMKEYNVSLDETAFLRIMNAEGLDIYWIPCFQNGIWTVGENASYFTVEHNEILNGADSNLLKWFLYRYEKDKTNFSVYVTENHDTDEFMNEVRNIWCAPLFPLLNGSMDDYLYAYNKHRDLKIDLPFGFSEKQVTFLKDGSVVYGNGNTIHVFEIYDYSEYVNFCKFVMESIIHDF